MSEQYLAVIGYQINRVDTQNDFFPKNLQTEWDHAVGVVHIDNRIVIVCNDGGVWRFSAEEVNDPKEVPTEVELASTKALVVCEGAIYAFCGDGSLYHMKIRRGRGVTNELSKGWENTVAAGALNGKLFVTNKQGQLLMVNPDDGSSDVLADNGWEDVKAIIGFGTELYAFGKTTFKVDILDANERIPVNEEHHWKSIALNSATVFNEKIYLLDSDFLYELDPETGAVDKKDECELFRYSRGKFVVQFPDSEQVTRDESDDENDNAAAKPEVQETIILIAYNPLNGTEVAKLLQKEVQELVHENRVRLLIEPGETFDSVKAEELVKKSTSLLAVLTAGALKQPELVLPLTVAKDYYINKSLVTLVHDAESCFFPGTEEQPVYIQDFFSEKAVTFLSCYAAEGAYEIATKFYREKSILEAALIHKKELFKEVKELLPSPLLTDLFRVFLAECSKKSEVALSEQQLDELLKPLDSNGEIDWMRLQDRIMRSQELYTIIADGLQGTEVHEDITTRLFLSHKRSSGQAIVGRLYEGLKGSYSIFLDSEAKFKIHDLKKIVQNTVCVVFVLSAGIFQSRWCMEELKAAVEFEKQIIVVRDLFFKFPDELPEEWKPFENILRTKDYLVWMAEYNNACVNAIKRRLGAEDSIYFKHIHPIKEWFQKRGKQWLSDVKESGKLVMSEPLEDLLFANEVRMEATLPYLKNLPEVHTASFREIASYYSTAGVVQKLLAHIKKELPNLKNLSLAKPYHMEEYYPDWVITSTANNRITFEAPDQPHNPDEELSFVDLPAAQCKQLPKGLKKLRIWTQWFKPEAQHMRNIIQAAPNLTHFTAFQLELSDSEDLFETAFPVLECLKLKGGSGFRNDFSWARYFQAHPKLKQLVLQDWWAGKSELISNAKQLTTLVLDGAGEVSLEQTKLLGDLPELQELTVASTFFWDMKDDDMLHAIGSGKFPKLRKFTIGRTYSNPLTSDQLKLIAPMCGNLTDVTIRSDSQDVDEGLIAIFSKCAKTLTTIGPLPQYAGASVKQWLLENCPNAQILKAERIF